MNEHINKEDIVIPTCDRCNSIDVYCGWVNVGNNPLVVAWICGNCEHVILPKDVELPA